MVYIKEAKKLRNVTEAHAGGTHLIVHSETFPMNTNQIGLRRFLEDTVRFCPVKKIASALEGLTHLCLHRIHPPPPPPKKKKRISYQSRQGLLLPADTKRLVISAHDLLIMP